MPSATSNAKGPRARRHAAVAVGSILLLLAPALAMPMAAAQSASLPPIGTTTSDIRALTDAGAPPGYASYWAGEWMSQHGWGGFNKAMNTSKAAGVTPVVYWYYWGDSISPSCVENGCNSRDRQEWLALTDQLATQLTTTLRGAEVIVVLENEFNKGGITGTYAPTFDAHLEGVAKTLKAVPGVKIVVGFGAWSEHDWAKFPKTIAQSDYIGFQMMRASTRDTEVSYRGAADRSVFLTNYIATNFDKPSFLYDLALSSYPDARWETMQAETLDAIFERLATDGNTGLKAVVYRSLNDHYMSPSNYYGYAESHWGLRKSDGTPKPALAVWLAHGRPTVAVEVAVPVVAPNAPPVAALAVSTSDLTATLDASGSTDADGDALAYTIDFGDGTTAAGPRATRTYAAPGSYAARVSVSDGNAVSTATATVVVTAPAPPAPFAATFSGVTGNTYWVQTSVSANRGIASVAASVDGGAWQPLALKSYGYADSFYVPLGSKVVFRATSTDGATATSAAYPWGAAPAPFAANFTGVTGNAYWVQTSVSANRALASVTASVDGGAWKPLATKSYGYAASFHVPDGSRVVFRATSTDGATVTSAPYAWPSATLATTSSTASPTTSTAPSATFTPYDGNTYWVQTKVSASQSVKSVCASLNGGACQPLVQRSWGAWANDIPAPTGTKVVFHAKLADGSTVRSATYTWPVK